MKSKILQRIMCYVIGSYPMNYIFIRWCLNPWMTWIDKPALKGEPAAVFMALSPLMLPFEIGTMFVFSFIKLFSQFEYI